MYLNNNISLYGNYEKWATSDKDAKCKDEIGFVSDNTVVCQLIDKCNDFIMIIC